MHIFISNILVSSKMKTWHRTYGVIQCVGHLFHVSIVEQFVLELEILGRYKFEYRTFVAIQVVI